MNNFMPVFVGFGLVAGLIWFLNRPVYYRHVSSSAICTHLKDFIKQCGSGSLLFIHHEGSKKMIQFALYGEADDAVLHFGYPDADWSREYFDKIASSLKDINQGFTIRDTEGQYVSRFIEVDWKVNNDSIMDSALATAKLALDVMGIGDGKFKIHYSGQPSKASMEDTIKKCEADSRFSKGILKRFLVYQKKHLKEQR